MFQPAVFHETRVDVLNDLMRKHPFATLVSSSTGALSADHVPLVLHCDEAETDHLRGHLGAGNPLCRQADGPIDVLAIFQGPQTYVTPSWYPSKKEHGKVVPTWNYVVVHAHGRLRFTRDENWLLRHLTDLTAQQESHRPEPWQVSDAPNDFVTRQLRGLVGFEIEIAKLAGIWKVSQNKAPSDIEGVIDGLRAETGSKTAHVADIVAERATSRR